MTTPTISNTIDRKEFFKLVGVSVGAVILQHCLSGCSNNDGNDPQPNAPVNTSINLNANGFAALRNKGGVVYNNGIIIARTLQDTFLAVSQACTHQGTTVNFNSNNNTFVCPTHGSVFSSTGGVQQGPAATPLRQYQTSFDATTGDLKIFS
jgi:cytochrome b6-f complex iron-sulfur subunit